MSLENFRRYFPVFKAHGFAVMYYIFPYVKRVAGRATQGQSRGPAELAPPLGLPQPLLAEIRPGRHPLDSEEHQEPEASRARRQAAFLPAPPGARSRRAQRQHLAARANHLLSARARRQQISVQHVGLPRGRLLRHSRSVLRFLSRLRAADGISLRPAERRLCHRADVEALFSYSWEGPTLRSTPPRPAAPNGKSSCATTTIFAASGAVCRCSTRRRSSRASRRGVPSARGSSYSDAHPQGRPQEPPAQLLFPRAAVLRVGAKSPLSW